MREKIEQAIKEALAGLGAPEASFVVERPADMAHGDYSTNAALAAAKILKKNPKEVAQELLSKLSSIEGVEKMEVAGIGFINFSLTHEALVPKEQKIPQLYASKVALVEYTSPNLFKPLHIGNLIGNILGESIARLLEASGAEVKRLNYPSDIGLTIAKGVWGLQKLGLDAGNIVELGKAYVAGNEAYESGEAKEAIEEINRALYQDSNPEWSVSRKKGIETSLKHLHELCEKLGTKNFDKEFFESQAGPVGVEIVNAHSDVFEKSDGAIVYKGEQDGLHTRVFLTSQGLPTYETKELGLFKLKKEAYPEFDISLTVTGSEQKDFFAVVFAAIRKLFAQELGNKLLKHIPTSFLRLSSGKMSSRKGNIVTGEALLAELTEAARGREDVAVGAIKYVVLRSGSGKDIIFSPEKSLSLEGDSGPYVQYALVRARALLRKAGDATVTESAAPQNQTLERLLIHFPDAVARAAEEMEPHYVTTYITELAAAFNSWYAGERVIVDGKISSYILNLIKVVEQTLAKGLEVLGIPAPEEM